MKQAFLFLTIFISIVGCQVGDDSNVKNNATDPIETILKKLTLEEKAGQLNLLPIIDKPTEEDLQMIRDGKVGSILKANGTKQVRQLQKIALEESRAKIPILFQEDVIHGYKTISPIPLGEAASWDLQAIKKSAEVAAREALASGIQLTYAPMVDVARDPRWGRILETSGEDPYLGSKIAEARVKGFQESNNGENNLLACVKHYVGYGASLAGKDYNIQDFSERKLREAYLPPFQAAIDAGVASVMCAYTTYNGVPLTANKFLMKDVLKGEMGFKGLTMTDWGTIDNLVKIGVAADDTIATEMAMNTGLDMDMASKKYVNIIPYLVRSGRISEEQVDNAVRQVLRLKMKAGLLDNPLALLDEEIEKKELLSERNLAEAKDIACKSMVLLKNENNILPLSPKAKNIAIIGPFAKANKDILGWWHCMGNPDDVVNYYDGISAEYNNSNITYAKGCDIDSFRQAGEHLIPQAVNIAKTADVVIMVLGEEFWMSGEGGGTASLHLPGLQEKLLDAVAKTGTPIITVINAGRPYVVTKIAKKSAALLYAWMPGTTGGTALAEIVAGKFNPQGKLPVTFPYHEGQVPIFYSYRKTSHPYSEGEIVNRYTATYRDIQSEPLYPFGYGLSYTTYKYSDITLSSPTMTKTGKISASIDITNTGKFTGTEIVQLYIHDKVCSITRPVKELKDFTLVELEPGETKSVTFEITADKVSFIGEDYKPTIEKGEFDLYIGRSSADFRKARFVLE